MSGPGRLLAWAYPSGPIDLLLRAAVLDNERQARTAWRQWADVHELNNVDFSTLRLLAAVGPRLEVLDPTHAARNRIVGIQRVLWSQSQLALREVQPALEILRQANIERMLLKGTARVARDAAAAKARFVNDVDLLVRPPDFSRAFDLLLDAGWRSTAAGSAQFQRATLATAHGVNLIRGDLADLDLHRTALHDSHQSLAEDVALWARSEPASLVGCPVRVPSATDTVVVALAHGGLGGHSTSDWLLDIVDAIRSGSVDWQLLGDIVQKRRLELAAAVSLSYVAQRLQCPVPADVLNRIVQRSKRRPLAWLTGMLFARPKNTLGRPARFARAVAKLFRLPGTPCVGQAKSPGTLRRARPLWRGAEGVMTTPVYRVTIAPGDRQADGSWSGRVETTISVAAPPDKRRIEFELNTGGRHIARLRHRKLAAGPRNLSLRFTVPVQLGPYDRELTLEAVPLRGLRANAAQKLLDRYGPLPFRVLQLKCQRRAA
jgi:hypothetical protein